MAGVKRAKKPTKVTDKQIRTFRGEQASERNKLGITVTMLDGPLRCLVPIPRNDLHQGQKEWTYPVRLGSATYRLVEVQRNALFEGGVHVYRWAP